MTLAPSTLHALAGQALDDGDLLAWHPANRQRTLAAVERFHAGAIDVVALRATLGGRPMPRASVAGLVKLTGVLTAGESLFTMLGCGTSLRQFINDVTAAADDPQIHSILVVCDSPGGSVKLVPEAAELLHTTRARKPVFVSVAGLAASAAYWIASNATAIAATPSAEVGSIGVIAQRASIHRLLDKAGIDVTTIAAGKYKTEGVPEVPMSDDERQHLQARVDATYRQFVDDIARGRRRGAAAIQTGFGDGRVLSADAALRAGMIDEIATVDRVIARLGSVGLAPPPFQTERAVLARLATAPWRRQQARASLAVHRRELAAAARVPANR